MPLWDLARDTLACFQRRCTIGAGESYRILRIGQPICEACSIELDNTPAPADMPALSPLERLGLRMPAYAPPPATTPDLRYLPSSQPRHSAARHRRVTEATRRSIGPASGNRHPSPSDFRSRASGERDE
jgi:hypothetical protein